jgi:hypothetical protein
MSGITRSRNADQTAEALRTASTRVSPDNHRRATFHVFLDGETMPRAMTAALTDFEAGVVVGLLVGEGSFGGDGKQPQVTLRMHTRHEALFRWLVERFPDSRLYGPYNHGGRSYFQWMARGTVLVRDLLPLLEARLGPDLDEHAAVRIRTMQERYAGFIARERARLVEDSR